MRKAGEWSLGTRLQQQQKGATCMVLPRGIRGDNNGHICSPFRNEWAVDRKLKIYLEWYILVHPSLAYIHAHVLNKNLAVFPKKLSVAKEIGQHLVVRTEEVFQNFSSVISHEETLVVVVVNKYLSILPSLCFFLHWRDI